MPDPLRSHLELNLSLQSTAIAEVKKEEKEQQQQQLPSGAASQEATPSTPTAENTKTIKPMSSSNSFDSTTNLNQSFRFKMSAEANRLFQTLQESPLPVEVGSPGEEPTHTISYSLSTHLPHPPCSLFVETQAKERRQHERHE